MPMIINAINPRTGINDYSQPATDPTDLEQIARRLRHAQPAWAAELEARSAILGKWAEVMASHSAELSAALTQDTGRRMVSALEVHGMVQRIAYWQQHAPQLLAEAPALASRTANNVTYRHQRIPYPLVGVISPWNFPLTLSLVDAIPALFAGCAVLLKPSEITPRFAAVLNDTIAQTPGLSDVMAVVLGGGDVGEALIDAVDMICFTGSVATGRKVAVRAAENFIPACLELGGKDPAIVLEDADLDMAADAILRSAAGSCGQACMSIERIYAHHSVIEPLIALLVAKAAGEKLNADDIGDGTLYPFIDQRQAEKVALQLEDALAKGARLRAGGAPENHGGGLWMRPTILDNVSSDMALMQDETFGPILPILSFDDDDDAVNQANQSDYGLSGSVFGDPEHAAAVASRINVGAVGINDASMTALIHDVEKQSFGLSGMGPSRMGDAGLLRFFRTKALMTQHDRAAPLSVLNEANLPG